ncbi:predicted protein, partial [Nematostella vectensis]
ASVEEWRERASFIDEDLKWLLCLPHNEFWCQVIFDDTLKNCLDSYLQHAPRWFDASSVVPREVELLQKGIHHRVFMVYLRMSTHKESQSNFLTPEVFGDILYNHFLFDIPKLMDLCALYGGESNQNMPLLRKMIVNIFSKQPKYYGDLDATIPTLVETLNNILSKCGLAESTTNSPQKLSEQPRDPGQNLTTQDTRDLVSYILDIGHTLTAFMETFPLACQSFHRQGLVQIIAGFFEKVMPCLRDCLVAAELKPLRQQLHRAKMALVAVCNMVIRACCIEPIVASPQAADELHGHVEDYLQILTSVLTERRFVSWYDARYSVESELITIKEAPGACLDETRLQYIVQAVSGAREAHPVRSRAELTRVERNPDREEPIVNRNSPIRDQNQQQDKSPSSASPSPHPADMDEVQLDSMVTSVRDLLPELGDGFVIKCLQHFNYSIEQVVNSILENTIPSPLDSLDRNMPKAQAMRREPKPATLISTRHSVFDKDEFDVLSRGTDIDLSRVHKGKKRDTSNLGTLLADKSHVTEAVKERLSRYDVYGRFDGIDEYDDEYDDTYDSHEVGAQDDDSADELTLRRPFTIPRVLRVPQADQEESEEEDEDNSEEQRQPSPESSQNGGEENQGRDKQRPDRQGGKERGQNKTDNKGPKAQKANKGTKGPKGSPPDAKTLRARAQKEKHKGQRANHNRKAGAEWKRNKGMGALPPQ